MKFLLSDESIIEKEDLLIRHQLYNEFKKFPKDFLSKMRHFQPQIGCFNNCSFCSKFSVCASEYWSEKTLRNIVSALKEVAKGYTNKEILLAWERTEHRVGVIFPYLDNDIGGYQLIDKYISLCSKELGVKTRISTVGYSRHNKILNEAHKRICHSNLIDSLAGVRISLTQYGRVWENNDNDDKKTDIEEYIQDIANVLKIYRPYYEKYGSGPRKMCVEIRYNPLVKLDKLYIEEYKGHMIIAISNYLFISREKNIKLIESHITDPYKHSLEISEKPQIFYEYNMNCKIKSKKDIFTFLNNIKKYNGNIREKELYMFLNNDGIYYSLDPKIANNGNYGINIYPKTNKRKYSGYIVTERFLLNAISTFKESKGLTLRDEYQESSWADVEEVLKICEKIAIDYKKCKKNEKYNYIVKHVMPIIKVYIRMLKEANYSPDCFFDSKFTIDTGMICNLGRAIYQFKGLSSEINQPLTPTHERNYGKICSTMKQENIAWRLSCGFKNTLIIEKLNMFNTASAEGQIAYKKSIKIENLNKKITEKTDDYLYPGVKYGDRIL